MGQLQLRLAGRVFLSVYSLERAQGSHRNPDSDASVVPQTETRRSKLERAGQGPNRRKGFNIKEYAPRGREAAASTRRRRRCDRADGTTAETTGEDSQQVSSECRHSPAPTLPTCGGLLISLRWLMPGQESRGEREVVGMMDLRQHTDANKPPASRPRGRPGAAADLAGDRVQEGPGSGVGGWGLDLD